MKTTISAILLLQATAVIAAVPETELRLLMPTEQPTATGDDPFECTVAKLPQYFDVPMPTGSLSKALQSYNLELVGDCEPTGTNVYGIPACTFPAPSRWCAFTTAAPSTLLPDFSSYASQASSWWSARSSKALDYAEICPSRWFKAMIETPGGAQWLNQTLILGECYAEANPTDDSMVMITAPTATAGSGATESAPQVTATTTSNGVLGRADGAEMWIVAGAGLVAMAVNSML